MADQIKKEVTINEMWDFMHESMDFIKENMVLKDEFNALRAEVASIRKDMATKEELATLRKELKGDIGKLRSDLIDFIDKKFFTLTDILVKKGVVTARDVQTVFGVDPEPLAA